MALYVATGTYTGNGADNRDITVSTSFAIKLLFIKRADAAAGAGGTGSISGMGDGAFDGWQNNPNQTNRIQSMGTGTFQVGSDATTNANGVTYHYCAIGGDDTEIKVGTYTGNGSDNRSITGVGFQPEFIAVKGALNSYAWWRFGTASDLTHCIGDQGSGANLIQSFDADGFTLGTDGNVNYNGSTFYYCAIKAVSGQTAQGTYTGNGSDNRDITGLGFTPELVFVKGSSTQIPVWRGATSHAGDAAAVFNANAADAANIIQSFASGSFQVGTDSRVNTNSSTYYYYAITNASAAPTFTPRVIMF